MLIGKGNNYEGLYVLDVLGVTTKQCYAHNVSTQLWHNRLGHVSFPRMQKLMEQLSCDVSSSKQSPCTVCPLAKQRRLSFDCHNHMSVHPFDLVHADIWGPFHELSYNGFRFFLTLVDDYSCFTWVYILKHKSDVSHIIPQFSV